MPSYYPKRSGDYVYGVTVTKDETATLLRRYRAHLSDVEHIEHGQLAAVLIDLHDSYGPTASEAMRVLDTHFETWRQQQPRHPIA